MQLTERSFRTVGVLGMVGFGLLEPLLFLVSFLRGREALPEVYYAVKLSS